MSMSTTEESTKQLDQTVQGATPVLRTCSINDLADVASTLTSSNNMPRRSKDWNEHYEELIVFKARYGHCNVPRGYKENVKLGRWVDKQRSSYKDRFVDKKDRKPWARSMKLEHVLKLEAIGFKFRLRSKSSPTLSWDARYNQLLQFRTTHGHAQVPLNWSGNTALSHWVVIQRKEHKKLLNGSKSSILNPRRLQMLIDVDFVFRNITVYPYSWDDRLKHLIAFKKTHGHFFVTSDYMLDPSLFIWVNAQRKSFQSKSLDPNQMTKLQEICFE